MPLLLYLVLLALSLITFGAVIDYIYKSKGVYLNTKRLSEETKDNMGISSSFM
ncbi:hypothetical protein [Bacillus sp. JJ1764]|uniref:hypothetical protein n=1 Tax=Bacillus sp. JJ1764 TaxID=3122964 RepID=UPI002FFE5F9D